jgi:uncharacterized protein YeaO (DUF488 family)
MPTIQTKRAYEPYSRSDGYRVLVDRLWPRGLTKSKAHINKWMQDIAPSTEARKTYGHDPRKWSQFRAQYRAELRRAQGKEAIKKLREMAKGHSTITLVFAAKDVKHSNATVLASVLRRGKKKSS